MDIVKVLTRERKLQKISQEQIANFVQNNSVQWVRNTQVNKLENKAEIRYCLKFREDQY